MAHILSETTRGKSTLTYADNIYNCDPVAAGQ